MSEGLVLLLQKKLLINSIAPLIRFVPSFLISFLTVQKRVSNTFRSLSQIVKRTQEGLRTKGPFSYENFVHSPFVYNKVSYILLIFWQWSFFWKIGEQEVNLLAINGF